MKGATILNEIIMDWFVAVAFRATILEPHPSSSVVWGPAADLIQNHFNSYLFLGRTALLQYSHLLHNPIWRISFGPSSMPVLPFIAL
jgi:hypothetical protein